MATNDGIRAIMRLKHQRVISQRQADLLMALETFTANGDGWRSAGADLMAEETEVSPSTAARARDELIARGWLEYQRGNGTGRVSLYRTHLPDAPKRPRAKGHQNVTTFEGHQNVTTFADGKGRQLGPAKVVNTTDKGRQ